MSTNSGGIAGNVHDNSIPAAAPAPPAYMAADEIANFLMLDPQTRAALAPAAVTPPTANVIPDFEEWRKIPRLNRECIVTEKIDGTNAVIYIASRAEVLATIPPAIALTDEYVMMVGSRSRWINPNDDNFGFARWAMANAEELFKLGPGRHYGEWWGAGIQRGYGLQKGEKRFSLFNTTRWTPENVPACVSVVPVLWKGLFRTEDVTFAVEDLRKHGSLAAPGFMKPEGVVVFHTHANQFFKVTLEKDEQPKGKMA